MFEENCNLKVIKNHIPINYKKIERLNNDNSYLDKDSN